MKMNHEKHNEVVSLIKSNIPVLLTGERGSGKTTLIAGAAKALGRKFYSLSMTRQTTLSHLLGFMNVNGIYVKSQLRKAAEEGGVFLLDELDAADPNVILSLNTVENGYISFPDEMVELHKDFIICATSNPQDNHKDYTGRAKLDAATLDRFDKIEVDVDPYLERSLVDHQTYSTIVLIRECLKNANSSTYISVRDTVRLQARRDLGLEVDFAKNLLKNDLRALEEFKRRKNEIPKVLTLSSCTTLKQVWEKIQ